MSGCVGCTHSKTSHEYNTRTTYCNGCKRAYAGEDMDWNIDRYEPMSIVDTCVEEVKETFVEKENRDIELEEAKKIVVGFFGLAWLLSLLFSFVF